MKLEKDDLQVNGLAFACSINGLSKQKFAELIGASPRDVSNWQKRGIPKRKQKKAEEILKIEVKYLNKMLSIEEQKILSNQIELESLYSEIEEDTVISINPETGEEYESVHSNIDEYAIQLRHYESDKNALLVNLAEMLNAHKEHNRGGIVWTYEAHERLEVVQALVNMLSNPDFNFSIIKTTIRALEQAINGKEKECFGDELFENVLDAVVKAKNNTTKEIFYE